MSRSRGTPSPTTHTHPTITTSTETEPVRRQAKSDQAVHPPTTPSPPSTAMTVQITHTTPLMSTVVSSSVNPMNETRSRPSSLSSNYISRKRTRTDEEMTPNEFNSINTTASTASSASSSSSSTPATRTRQMMISSPLSQTDEEASDEVDPMEIRESSPSEDGTDEEYIGAGDEEEEVSSDVSSVSSSTPAAVSSSNRIQPPSQKKAKKMANPVLPKSKQVTIQRQAKLNMNHMQMNQAQDMSDVDEDGSEPSEPSEKKVKKFRSEVIVPPEAVTAIHCGVVDAKGVRHHREENEFFASVLPLGSDGETTIAQPTVNVYTAETDGHRRTLYCCGDLAKRFEPGNDSKRMNKVGMWMSRRKGVDGVFQASSILHKEQGPSSRGGLKTSGYFFTLEIAEWYQQHVLASRQKVRDCVSQQATQLVQSSVSEKPRRSLDSSTVTNKTSPSNSPKSQSNHGTWTNTKPPRDLPNTTNKSIPTSIKPTTRRSPTQISPAVKVESGNDTVTNSTMIVDSTPTTVDATIHPSTAPSHSMLHEISTAADLARVQESDERRKLQKRIREKERRLRMKREHDQLQEQAGDDQMKEEQQQPMDTEIKSEKQELEKPANAILLSSPPSMNSSAATPPTASYYLPHVTPLQQPPRQPLPTMVSSYPPLQMSSNYLNAGPTFPNSRLPINAPKAESSFTMPPAMNGHSHNHSFMTAGASSSSSAASSTTGLPSPTSSLEDQVHQELMRQFQIRHELQQRVNQQQTRMGQHHPQQQLQHHSIYQPQPMWQQQNGYGQMQPMTFPQPQQMHPHLPFHPMNPSDVFQSSPSIHLLMPSTPFPLQPHSSTSMVSGHASQAINSPPLYRPTPMYGPVPINSITTTITSQMMRNR